MTPDKDFWSQDRPPDDPYAYRVVTVGHGAVEESFATLRASVPDPATEDLATGLTRLRAAIDALAPADG